MTKKSSKVDQTLMKTAIALEIARFPRDSLKGQVKHFK